MPVLVYLLSHIHKTILIRTISYYLNIKSLAIFFSIYKVDAMLFSVQLVWKAIYQFGIRACPNVFWLPPWWTKEWDDGLDHLIDPSWWTHWAISRSSQCSMTGVTKAVVCAILSLGWCI